MPLTQQGVSKCNPNITAHIGDIDISVEFVLNTKTKPAHYVPVVNFRFSCESLFESEFLQHYPTPDLLTRTAEKLKWYRLKNGYLQSEIADIIEIYRSTYIHYEEPTRKFYELDKLQLLADLYQVDIECLLDDYMLFLYRGQGKQLKALRKELGLTQRQFADMVGVPIGNLKYWEQERCVMLYENFVKVMSHTKIETLYKALILK